MNTQYPRAGKIIVYAVAGALGVEYLEVPELLEEALHHRPVQQLPAKSPLDLPLPNSYGHPETPGVPTAPRQSRTIALTTGTSVTTVDISDLITSIKSRAGR